jgi:hypothetical protein
VRPDNVLRADESGRHSLCDFGIAGVLETGDQVEPKLTKTGEILGHPAYISPEQMDGSPLTDRADIYSLGVLAHELLTGHTPPPLGDLGGRRGAAVELEPLFDYLGDSDPKLVELIGRCLAWDPAHRPSAADVERKMAEETNPAAVAPYLIPRPAGTFFSALMERRFFQIIGGYVAGGFLFLELVDQLVGHGYLHEIAYAIALRTGLFGFFAVNILAWFHGERGRQKMPRMEKGLLAGVVVGWVVVVVWLVVGWVDALP